MIREALLATVLLVPFHVVAELIPTEEFVLENRPMCQRPEAVAECYTAVMAHDLARVQALRTSDMCVVLDMKYPLQGKNVITEEVLLRDRQVTFSKEAIGFHTNRGRRVWALTQDSTYVAPVRVSQNTTKAPQAELLSIVGIWTCTTANPDNITSNDHYRFNSGGNFSSSSGGTRVPVFCNLQWARSGFFPVSSISIDTDTFLQLA